MNDLLGIVAGYHKVTRRSPHASYTLTNADANGLSKIAGVYRNIAVHNNRHPSTLSGLQPFEQRVSRYAAINW
jgi:hypothetical protein